MQAGSDRRPKRNGAWLKASLALPEAWLGPWSRYHHSVGLEELCPEHRCPLPLDADQVDGRQDYLQ